ncbi:hypothetical protein EH221_01975 [bacterium]|nr:MAG: hypothetical protein EH221_01975 [bacterium]
MQWTSGKNLGFSTAAPEKLYLPVDAASDAPNVEDQLNDPNSLLNRVKKLIQLKKHEKALQAYAEFVPVYAKENAYPFIYARACDEEMLLILLNPAVRESRAEFKLEPEISSWELLAGSQSSIQKTGNRFQVTMSGQSYSIYKLIK